MVDEGRVTQVAAEVARIDTNDIRVTMISLEVIRSIDLAPVAGTSSPKIMVLMSD